tara:strand:+ start:8820 stop:9074 length:255 start_codon:yes stop_codon:yes gene_type:complete
MERWNWVIQAYYGTEYESETTVALFVGGKTAVDYKFTELCEKYGVEEESVVELPQGYGDYRGFFKQELLEMSELSYFLGVKDGS